jgi:hypothetical protein
VKKSIKIGAVAFAAVAVVGTMIAIRQRPTLHDWRTIDSPDGKFEISFPAKPTLNERLTTSSRGGTFTSHSLNLKSDEHAAFGVSWWDDPSMKGLPDDEILNRARDSGIGGVQGKLISETPLTLRGYPARDIDVSTRGNLTMKNRLILAAPTLYTLIVIESDGSQANRDAGRFFNSFRIH